MRNWYNCFFLLLLSTTVALAQYLENKLAATPPKREFRGAWIATVVNLDWPTSRTQDPTNQRPQLTSILDGLKAAGINAVMFQVRSECDAMYPSNIEPWSYWLTGQQGTGSLSPFDPLQFAIQEAHARGIELHAWLNPYRAERQIGNYPVASNHVTKTHTDWIITSGGTVKMLDPGVPQAREYITSVVTDIVRRYPEVDGIHFDDYFYPYSPKITTEDNITFANFSRGFTDINNWRRDNTNLLIKMVNDSIRAINPRVKFGIAPFGIWKNGTPSGITGLSAYDDIFCDATAWLAAATVDYIAPELYWPFGGQQDYAKLAPWWASVAGFAGRHFYVGQAPYRINVADGNWGPSELPNQVRFNRSTANVSGSIFFRARDGINDNPKGFADSLKNDLYKYLALRPIMSWKDAIPPNAPANFTITKNPNFFYAVMNWTAPAAASDGERASQYVLYRSTSLPIAFDDARNIVAIQSSSSYLETFLPLSTQTFYYAVTALDRLQNESSASNIVAINSSGVVGVEEPVGVPRVFVLEQNYPNPFNASTIIQYTIPSETYVSLKVYDVLGREVAVLEEGTLSAGIHQRQFDGRDLSSGLYLYRLVADGKMFVKKMQLLK